MHSISNSVKTYSVTTLARFSNTIIIIITESYHHLHTAPKEEQDHQDMAMQCKVVKRTED
jgi:hypothetical protein